MPATAPVSRARRVTAEGVATAPVMFAVIWGCARRNPAAVPVTVAAYIPAGVPGFVLAQLAGAAAATLLFRWLVPASPGPWVADPSIR